MRRKEAVELRCFWNLFRNECVGEIPTKGRSISQEVRIGIKDNIDKSGRLRAKRNNVEIGEVPSGRSGISAESDAKLVGDYEQRRSGRTTDGELVCFECGNTSRLMGDCPFYLANVTRYNTVGWEVQSVPDGRRKGSNGRKAHTLDLHGYLVVICKMRKVPKIHKSSTAAAIMLIFRNAMFYFGHKLLGRNEWG